jgi:trimethylamine:corrinoid methyltransferase-like protein
MEMATDELYLKPRLQVISQTQIDQIHCATLDVLERTGVDIPHAKALELLSGHGARVAGDRVKMLSWMVEDAIDKAPSRVVLGTRTGKHTITLERDKTYFGPSLDCVDYLDPQTHVRSRFVSENVKVTAALCDALPHLHWAMIIGMADDVPPVVNPGEPFMAGAQATVMDMRTTVFSYDACEMSLMTAALAQMAQHYRLPFFGTAGATDAKFCDAQAGAEATFQCLAAAATGYGLVHDCGSWMDHGSLASPEFMVLANEIVDTVDHFMKGIPLTAGSLALDVIHRVGPCGHFLQESNTFNNFKKIRYSEIFDRSILDQWEASGSQTFEQRLQAVTLKKMEHRPEPLPDDTIKILDEMQRGWT